jgi:hypothetical protein
MEEEKIMKKQENFLDKVPCRNESITWSEDTEGIVTLEIENKGVFNTIAQKLFKKPRISYVHLEEIGSFIWKRIDGKKSVSALADELKEEFGDKAEPLYERISKYIQILNSYNFINF